MFSPLDGVRIIDTTHVLAGPYCTNLLAMLGATVVKIEPPITGDMTRFGGPIPELNRQQLGLAYCTQYSDKAAITVDLKTERGVAIVRQLVAEADVYVENFRPGVSERLGLGYEAMLEVNPELVYVSLTAYGQNGPIGHRPAYDHVVQAMSGIMETTGTTQTGPIKVGAPYVDYAAGQKGAFATLAAIVEQRRTGQPQRVDSAMLDTTLLLMANTLTATAASGERPPKLGNQAASGAASSGCFETADGLVAIAANNQRQFTDLCRAIDRPELIGDARFADQASRQQNAETFRDLLAAVLATEPAAVWEQRFDAVGVPASRVRSLDELIAEGQPHARELLREVTVEDHTIELPTVGVKFNGDVPGPVSAPRPLGADNDTVLAELGYEADEIDQLRSDGVI